MSEGPVGEAGAPGALELRHASTAPDTTTTLVVRDGVLVDPEDAGDGPRDVEDVVDLGGRPVVPGLADHHIHLFALAATRHSVALAPDALDRAGGLTAALRAARVAQRSGWLRGIGYDVATSGPLDRDVLDHAGVGPVRVQDRTGIQWILDSAALREVLPADARDRPDGVEEIDGRPTGVLRRLDPWLRERVPAADVDLTALGRRLASTGLTAVTDAGADNDADTLAALAAAGMPLRVTAMTRDAEVEVVDTVDRVALGPVKILLDDATLPTLEDLAARVGGAHGQDRNVAVHCVSAAATVLALHAGLGPGDRIEHATQVPHALDRLLVESGVTVVVQPGLVYIRGDRYLRDHPPDEHRSLHRLGTLRAAGVPVAAGSDAPYGDPDPWLSIATATHRRTAAGVVFNGEERIDAADALGLYAGTASRPDVPRRLVPGAPADLVVLDEEWSVLGRMADAPRPRVLVTAVAGVPTHGTWPR